MSKVAKPRKRPKYEKITKRWGGMDVRYEYGKKISTWLTAFDKDEQPQLLTLLGYFQYYSEKKLKEKAKELKNLLDSVEPKYENPVFIPIIREVGAGYSDLFFDNFWCVNDLKSYAERNILMLLENDQIPQEIIIVDDYSGTGKTVKKTLNKLINTNEQVRNSNIIFLVIHITRKAKEKILAFADSERLHLKVLSLEQSEEAFKEGYLFKDIEAQQRYRSYLELCRQRNIKHELGYGAIQSLVAFNYNTPNNTLGIFWQDLKAVSALFPRDKKDNNTTLVKMQRRVGQKNAVKKSPPIVYGIHDFPIPYFLGYCLAKGKDFSFREALVDFGLTKEMLDKLIDEMIDKGYIRNNSGQFIATDKLNDVLFSSRLKTVREVHSDCMEPRLPFKITTEDGYIPKNF